MIRRHYKEVVGWLALVAFVYFGLLGGPLPSFGSIAPDTSESTSAAVEPIADPGTANVAQPINDEVPVTDPTVKVTSQVVPHSTSGTTALTAASGTEGAAVPSPWTSMPTIVLLIIIVATTVLILALAYVTWFLHRHRRPTFVTPEGVQIEVEAQSSAVTPRRSPLKRQPLHRSQTTPQLPAPVTPVVERPWSYLTAVDTLAAYRALGHTPEAQELIPNPQRRILELMADFRAPHAIIAPDQSVVVFPGVVLPLDEITRRAAPQPAVLSANKQTPIVVVGMWQSAPIVTSSEATVEPVSAAPPTSMTRAERTAHLIPSIPHQVPFPLEQLSILPRGTLPVLLAVQGPQGTQHRWVTRSIFSGHWGIAGKSQRGKGNFLRYMLLSLLALPPEQLQVIVIDLKGGADFGFILKLAHAKLYTPRVDGQSIGDGDLAEGLSVAINEMVRRNQLFVETGVRTIAQYNAKFPDQPLPLMVVVVDEAFDLPTALKERLHSLVARCLSAGIFVFVSTQHPANVLSTQIRGNYTNYVAFRVEQGRNYVEAALGLTQGGDSLYDPSAMPDTPGIAIVRFDGQEHLGRVPEITDDLQDQLTQRLATQYPRSVAVAPTSEQASSEHQSPVMSPQGTPKQPEQEIDLAKMSAADLIQALSDPDSPARAVAIQWLDRIGHRTATPSMPEQADEPAPDLRPYDLVSDDSPHKISLKECVEHPVIVAAVLRVYNDLKTKLGFHKLSGRLISDHVFERVPGSADGWTSTRWTSVVKPILAKHDLALPTQEPVSVSGAALAAVAESGDRAA